MNGMPPNVEMVYTDIGDEVIAGRELSYCSDYDNPCRERRSGIGDRGGGTEIELPYLSRTVQL